MKPPSGPAVVNQATFQAELDALRMREKAHTREGDAIAAARRRLPMLEVDSISHLQSRDVKYATFCQGPFDESVRYRDFMGWEMPWYSAPRESLEKLLVGRRVGMFHLVCYLRDGSRVFETYWSTGRGAEAMSPSYPLLDMTVYGRQEQFEDSPEGWPKFWANDGSQFRTDGRPTAQWARLAAGRSDDLGNGGGAEGRAHCH